MKPDLALYDQADDAAEAAADAEGVADLEAGRVVSHDAMKAWLLSWGTDDPLPAPEVESAHPPS